MIKQIMIPLAAFAVTVTAASAFTGSDWMQNLDVDLTDAQISALEEAHEIRQTAAEQAQEVLEEAGVDEELMKEIHEAHRENQRANHEAIKTAINNKDYNAFITAIADTPMSEVIDTEAEFEKIKEAHNLRETGDFEAAQSIMSELGLEGPHGGMMGGEGRDGFGGPGHGDRQSAKTDN